MVAFFIALNIYSKEKKYSMPRLAAPIAFHPRLKFRYALFTSKLPGTAIYARSVEQPSFTNSPVTIDYMSNYWKMKGKTRWNNITLSCYQFEGITVRELYKYLNRDHMDVSDGTDMFAEEYKHLMQLFLLSPSGVIPTGTWKLHGAFISDASWGSMDYGLDDVVECEITISYDYAEFIDVFDFIGGLFG